MYTDYHLKFEDANEAQVTLYDGEQPLYAAIDIIGIICKPTGKMLKTDEGLAPEMKAIPGFHVNVRHTEEAPELDAFAIQVDNPVRIWA